MEIGKCKLLYGFYEGCQRVVVKSLNERLFIMKERYLWGLVSLTFLGILLTPSSWAGQVVTEDIRLWAGRTLAQEKTLGAVITPDTVAVLYFNNKTERTRLDFLRKGLTLMLITDLSKISDIRVIERVRLQALVEELGLGVSGLVASGTVPRVGKLLGAEYIIGGDFIKGKIDEFQIKSNLLEVPGGEVFGLSVIEGILKELFRMEKDLLFEIIKYLKTVKLTPEKEEELRKPLSTDVEALFSLFKGIESSDRGNYGEAAIFYEKALKKDPGLKPAKGAMQELYHLGLITKKKRRGALMKSLRDRTSLTDSLTPEAPLKRALTPGDVEQRDTSDVTISW